MLNHVVTLLETILDWRLVYVGLALNCYFDITVGTPFWHNPVELFPE